MANPNEPSASYLSNHTDSSLLVKILAELRVQTIFMQQAFYITDDISRTRDEVMSLGNTNPSEL